MQFLFKTKKTSEKFYAPIIKRLSSKRFSAARFEIEIFGTILTDYHYSILLFWDGSIYDKKKSHLILNLNLLKGFSAAAKIDDAHGEWF